MYFRIHVLRIHVFKFFVIRTSECFISKHFVRLISYKCSKPRGFEKAIACANQMAFAKQGDQWSLTTGQATGTRSTGPVDRPVDRIQLNISFHRGDPIKIQKKVKISNFTIFHTKLRYG